MNNQDHSYYDINNQINLEMADNDINNKYWFDG